MSKRRASILIIDDDEVLLATTQALLEAVGYEVRTHAGPFGATSVIMSTQPDLVLLDVNMPGLSGPGLVDVIRSKASAPASRIFFFSSSDDEVLRAAVEETGADGYLRKGDRTQLAQDVERALAG